MGIERECPHPGCENGRPSLSRARRRRASGASQATDLASSCAAPWNTTHSTRSPVHSPPMFNLTRRNLFKTAFSGVTMDALPSLSSAQQSTPVHRKGRIQQSASRWCYKDIPLEKLCAYGAEIGLKGIDLLNSKVDHKDYMCDHSAWGLQVVQAVNSPRIKLLYDIYHMQIMEGDLVRTIQKNIDWLGHFHTGGVPHRHELDGTQEVQWDGVMRGIAATNYRGYVAHEFVPTRDPLTSLREAVDLCDV